MTDRVYTCGCGRRIRISEYQVGMESTCPECRADIHFTESNTELMRTEAPADPTPPAASQFEAPPEEQPRHGLHAGDFCARCGRKFRGDWDQHDSPMGMVCNVCANLALENAPGTPATEGMVKPIQSIAMDAEPERKPVPEAAERPKPTLADRYPTQMKLVLWTGVGLVFFAAFYYTFIDTTPPEVYRTYTDDEMQAIASAETRIPVLVVRVGDLFFSLLSTVLTLYLTLVMTNRLPHESFSANAVHTVVMGAGISLIFFAGSFLPLVGGLLALIIVLYLLWDYYDLDLYGFVMLIVNGMLVGILVWALKIFVYGSIGVMLRPAP